MKTVALAVLNAIWTCSASGQSYSRPVDRLAVLQLLFLILLGGLMWIWWVLKGAREVPPQWWGENEELRLGEEGREWNAEKPHVRTVLVDRHRHRELLEATTTTTTKN